MPAHDELAGKVTPFALDPPFPECQDQFHRALDLGALEPVTDPFAAGKPAVGFDWGRGRLGGGRGHGGDCTAAPNAPGGMNYLPTRTEMITTIYFVGWVCLLLKHGASGGIIRVKVSNIS